MKNLLKLVLFIGIIVLTGFQVQSAEIEYSQRELNENLIKYAKEGDLNEVKFFLKKGATFPKDFLDIANKSYKKGSDILMGVAFEYGLAYKLNVVARNFKSSKVETAQVRFINTDIPYKDGMFISPGVYDIEISNKKYLTIYKTIRLYKESYFKGKRGGTKKNLRRSLLSQQLRPTKNSNFDVTMINTFNTKDEAIELIEQYEKNYTNKSSKLSPITHALMKGNLDIAGMIIKNNGKLNLTIPKGIVCNYPFQEKSSPIHFACGLSDGVPQIHLLKLLIDNGANVNYPLEPSKDFKIWTPLHACIASHNYRGSKILINRGANINTKDGAGRTPLRLALQSKNKPIISLLKKHGAHR